MKPSPFWKAFANSVGNGTRKRGWVHFPLSVALIVLMAVHVVVAFKYL